MAHARSGTSSGPREPIVDGSMSDQDLSALVARLGDGIVELVDGKLTLLKLDFDDLVHGYVQEATVVALASASIAIGMALLGTGLAFAIAWALPTQLDPLLARAAAFGAIGVLTTAAGCFVVWRRGAQRAH